MRDGESNSTNGTSRPFSNGSSTIPLQKASFSSSTNGVHGTAGGVNGSTTPNGRPAAGGKSKPTYFGHDREEVSRILIQALTDLGYNGAAASLSQESGYDLESPAVAAFRNAVLEGEWSEAEDLLFGGSAEEGGVSIYGSGLALRDGVDKSHLLFQLRQQKFLELLEQRDHGSALIVLRMELTPLYQDISRLHFLSSLLMLPTAEDVKFKAEWDGAHGASRYNLLSDLSRCISPSVMLPEHRLGVLLDQVKKTQIATCLYHNTSTSPSLYQDHSCDRSNFPVRSVLELAKHAGEVWFVQFSHDGTRLASCGQDGTILIYDVETWQLLHRLEANDHGVASLSWSPDDSLIVGCCQDKKARLWNARTGELRKTLPRFGEPVSSSCWSPDGQTFVTGCLDKTRSLFQWSLNGEPVYDWGSPHRVQDIAISPNGHYLVVSDASKQIHVYNFVTRELRYAMDIKCKLSSISISQDSRSLLILTVDSEARIIDLETKETIRHFRSGDRTGPHVIRAGFGGANESFVITGSESGNVYIWHKENGTRIEKLEGHEKGPCNSVSWNPTDPRMFASAGDDGKVRIWSNGDPQSRSTPKASRQSSRARDSNEYGIRT